VYIKQLFLLLSCALLFQPLFAQATYAEKAAGDSAAISLKTVQAITTPDVISPQTINFDYLITHHEILQKVQEGYFIKKAAATIPDNNFCITVAEAKAWLTLDESQLPVNGRMPVYQQLVPTAQCTGVNKKVINGYLRNRCTDLDQERIERNHTYMEMLLRLAMV
jgi:hypothetical protein